MTNVLAPYSESKSIYNGYQKMGMLDTTLNFIIPVYNNMPEVQTQSPDINPSEFQEDNTKVYCNNSGKVNIRTGPSTSYEIITTVTNTDKMTRIQKGIGQGERWDRVILENGIIGYIYQTYVTEVKDIPIESINISVQNPVLQKGEDTNLQVTIHPQEASNNKLEYISSNPQVATIYNEGNIKAISSGTTIITVKSPEYGVQSEIQIQVYSKVTGIIIDQKDINMVVGDNFKINAYIEPDDANNKNVIYKSGNEEIATIDENGIITANKEGDTIVTISSEENNEIKQECKLTVVRKMEDYEIHFDSSLNINSLEVSGIQYDSNTVLDIKNKITTNLDIQIVNNKNEVLQDSQIVGTGSKILVKEQDKILREYKIIVYGDSNGEGKINSVDLLELDEIYIKASNIAKNGKKPTSVDLLLIQRHILGLQIINQ